MPIQKALLILLVPLMFSSCAGLRDHIRQRQLETHGPPKSIRDNRSDRTERKDKTRRDTLSNISDRNTPTGIYAKYGEKWKVELSGTKMRSFSKK